MFDLDNIIPSKLDIRETGRGVGSCFCFYGKFVENGWYFVPNIRISDWN
jgi:hypothetical protein